MRLLEPAHAGSHGAGERALGVSEQLGFDKVLRQRAAIDRHQRRARAAAGHMDSLRHSLFARSGLAGDQHSRLPRTRQANDRPQFAHGLALADQQLVPGFVRFRRSLLCGRFERRRDAGADFIRGSGPRPECWNRPEPGSDERLIQTAVAIQNHDGKRADGFLGQG